MSTGKLLVVGGGFSGLSAATMLARSGWSVDIVERNHEWTMDGAGISVGGATLRALNTLGVLDRFLGEGAGVDGTQIRAPDGQILAEIPTQRLVSAEVPGNGAIMRPLLGRILVTAALDAGATAHLGTTVEQCLDQGTHLDIILSDGRRRRYDLMVAAEGIMSATRAELFPEGPAPAFSGQGAWRGVVPRPEGVDQTILWVGARAKVGVNPISRTQMYLFVNENAGVRERVTDDQLLPRLLGLVEPFSDPLLRSVVATLGEDSLLLYRPMDNLLVPLPWHRGRVVLIGDAVHATTPHLAAGAGIGIEDAIVLAQTLADETEIETALVAFERRRWDRCRMVVENSARLGELETEPHRAKEFTRLQAESFRELAQPI